MENTPGSKRPRVTTTRERILAALQRRPVDGLLLVPIIDRYTLCGRPHLITKTFRAFDEAIGDDGITTVSLSTSPLMFLIEELCGLTTTCYLLQDHQENELCKRSSWPLSAPAAATHPN